MKFSANISFLFSDLPMEQRVAAARNAGFDGIEILFPYEENAAQIAKFMAQNAMPLALMNCPPPNYTGGSRGFAAIPGESQRFQRDLRRALRYAQTLGAEHIHLMAGVTNAPEAREVFVENLRYAVAQSPKQSFTIEPLNQIDMPGYYLSDFQHAVEIIEEVGAPNLGLQYDCYHAHMIDGDPLKIWEKYADYVRHIQIGDAPGRGEPGSGQIDFEELFSAFKAYGYANWVSAEYKPSTDTLSTLGWLPK